ncbi:sugar ABC transporter substrate-binding protein [Acidaminobacter sp. JC074]|uniref:ABC transporter substrate-binding protein n=1 Tax=Acidaminobacter sp. JC074 TaxID=2530199 RepID=UPI001F0FB295|nr:sugar ABC transporter substrate-binding protein [Acidaminobacter sp. JC074]MCH4888406.1 sugar ABC transporter substrate-binding protein [Acidaminobacter sp. JC074]
MFKKMIAITIVLLMLAGMFVGCAKEEAKDQGPVTLEFALWNKDQEPVMQEIIKVFEEKNPDIKVNVQLTPYKQYWTKMETAATASSMPDVFWMNGPRFINYAKNGMLMSLDQRIKSSDIDLSKYPQGLLDLYTYNDQLYGIAKDWDTTALWYNKELFDNAGLDYPSNDWTWDDMMAAAEKLTDADNGIYGTAAVTGDNQTGLYNTIAAAGGYVLSDDRKSSGYGQAETVKGIQVWMDMLDSGVSPTIEQLTDTSENDMFTSGKVAMLFGASWNVKPFMENEMVKDKLDLVMLPTIKDKGAVIHGLINAVAADTKHPEEAWKLVEFLASKEASDIWAKSGVVIPSHADSLELWVNSYPDINLQAYVDMLPYAKMYPSAESSMWADAQGDILKQIWNGQISVEDGAKEIDTKMNELLGK